MIWVISKDFSLQEEINYLTSNKHQSYRNYSYTDFKRKCQSPNETHEQPSLYIFDEGSAFDFFYEERNFTVDPAQVIVLGDDNPASIRLFYSIGLSNFIIKNSFQNLLQVKIEFMLGELLVHGQLSLTDFKCQDLTFKEKKILKILCHRPDQAVDRHEIIKFVWKNKRVHSRTFDVHLHNLRKKLQKYGHEIITHGQGKYQIQSALVA